VKPYFTAYRSDSQDPLQFAYKEGYSPTDEIVHAIDFLANAVDGTTPSTGRELSMDLSSAFNSMRHKQIVKRLIDINVPYWFLRWIISFLSGRVQVVIIEGIISKWIRILIGSAQGEVMSGDLLNCMTDSIQLDHPNRKLLKFADDMFLVARISDRKDFDQYQDAVKSITDQLGALDLQINDDKTKELVIDFTKNQRITSSLPSTLVLGKKADQVSCLRMVGYELKTP
jgi:hypothetical protein